MRPCRPAETHVVPPGPRVSAARDIPGGCSQQRHAPGSVNLYDRDVLAYHGQVKPWIPPNTSGETASCSDVAVRAAVADFVERYNQTWRLEKLGYQTPIEAREEYVLRQAA